MFLQNLLSDSWTANGIRKAMSLSQQPNLTGTLPTAQLEMLKAGERQKTGWCRRLNMQDVGMDYICS